MPADQPRQRCRPLIFIALLAGMFGPEAQGQSIPIPSAFLLPAFSTTAIAEVISPQPASDRLRDAAGQQKTSQPSSGSVHGTVADTNGDVIVGASVTLEIDAAKGQRTLFTDGAGFFSFTSLAPGTYRVTITSKGFAAWVKSEIVLPSGTNYELPQIVLQVASANTDVEVVFTRHDLAEEEIKAQEKQRVLGVFPNFYTSYVWNAVPLTAKQKYRLALRTSIDPVAFVGAGVTAGIEQWQNYFSGYGQGSEGYFKRFGASYTDGFVSTMIGAAILPSLLHQDPRYFYKGTGSVGSRALYAISTVVICKGDNGRWQPNYSNVLGNLASAGISNLYYPSTNRNGAQVTIDNALIGTAEGAVSALIQEFVLRKISRRAQPSPAAQP